MDLLQSFKDFTAKEHLFSPTDRLLVAVSGGVDSVVLCHCCHQAGLDFVIAHCNFQLRGDESQKDESFVRQLAAKYGRPVLVQRMDTHTYSAAGKVSIQVAARELRYNWFRELTTGTYSGPAPISPTAPGSSISPDSNPPVASIDPVVHPPVARWILTAHHLDDNIETLLMNFFKGTGIAGLRAILPRQGNIVRPLLFAPKETIKEFAVSQGLSWREDSSNQSDKYTRNYFRHQVIPLVGQVFPGALNNLADNISRFREIETLYQQSLQQHKAKLLEHRGQEIHIPVLKLKKSTPLPTLVYEIIAPFGFSPQQVPGVIDLLDSDSGKYMLSSTHRILKNRNWLIISAYPSAQSSTLLIESPGDKIIYDRGELKLELLTVPSSKSHNGPVSAPACVSHRPSAPIAASESIPAIDSSAVSLPDQSSQPKAGPKSASHKASEARISSDPLVAQLDADKIRFPLLLRRWKQGDYFYPLGLDKKKKLARFLIDNKLSLADKERVWVIEMNKKIIWVVGLRIDHRFRITPQTSRVLKITESRML